VFAYGKHGVKQKAYWVRSAGRGTIRHDALERGLGSRSAGLGALHQAIEALCRTYWFPLYAYLRRQGYSRDMAEENTQAAFAIAGIVFASISAVTLIVSMAR
jgi:hypothetical protein